MARAGRRIVVDTYAVMADLLGQVPRTALGYLEDLRRGKVVGLIHCLIVFELAYHWRRGRLPFYDERELLEFVSTYFRVVTLDPELAASSARIKVVGDRLLRESGDQSLSGRRLSAADAATIAIAKRLGIPVLSGDKDLTYVAEQLGVKVIW